MAGMPMLLDPSEADFADEIARRVVKLLRESGPVEPRAVMTWREAALYAGKHSSHPFRAWCKKWHVYSCSYGRFAKTTLNIGLSRDARGVRDNGRRKAIGESHAEP